MDEDKIITNGLKNLLYSNKTKKELSKQELLKNIIDELNIHENLNDVEIENVICNYVYTTYYVNKDLIDIENTIKALKKMENEIPASDEYFHKKIRYFAALNKKAQSDVTDFISNRLYSFIVNEKKINFIERKKDELSILFFKMRYDYSYFKQYYDIDYDYSVEAKFRFLPGVDLLNMQEMINKYITLHREKPQEYSKTIDEIVKNNNCMDYIRKNVMRSFILSKRIEIFDTLVELYESKKYQTFITLATIQLEGVFFDCCEVLNKKTEKKNFGSLIEKADKVFDDIRVRQALYPHFAFTVPVLRNDIAHKGMTDEKDLCNCANEICLDLYTMVHWANSLIIDKYFAISQAYGKMQKKQDAIEEIVFCELLGCYQLKNREFIDVLARPEEYKKETDFYKNLSQTSDTVSFKDEVDKISMIVKSQQFWKYINDSIIPNIKEHVEGKPYGMVDFISHLRNAIIPTLKKDSLEKLMCQEVSKKINAF